MSTLPTPGSSHPYNKVRTARSKTRHPLAPSSTSHDQIDIGFLYNVKSTFLPIFERLVTLAQKYRLFDLVPYLFGNIATNQEMRPPSNPSDILSMKNCSHSAHKNLENTAVVREISVYHFKDIVEIDLKEAKGGDVALANYNMNGIFIKRLLDIEGKAPSDILLKLLTYQEWVEMLLKLNNLLITNMRELEKEVCIRMSEMKEVDKAVNEELAKNRHDIASLVRFIRNGYFKGVWKPESLKLYTLSPAKVFGKPSRSVVFKNKT